MYQIQEAIGLCIVQWMQILKFQKLQIISFNNTIIEMVRPQLSSVIQPLYDIGAVGMRLLTKYMNDEKIKNQM